MRTFASTLLAAGLVVSGCASHRGSAPSFTEVSSVTNSSPALPSERLIVTPDNQLVGKIAKVNLEGRFVILTFPIGHLPTMQQRLSVYHLGLKSGEVRVTGPQLDDNVVGDLTAGDAQPGDEVRAQ